MLKSGAQSTSFLSWGLASTLSLAVHGGLFATLFVFEPVNAAKSNVTTIDLVDVDFNAGAPSAIAAEKLAMQGVFRAPVM